MRAVIFDMDGLLIDSEPLWQRAEIEVFGSRGLRLSVEQCLQTQGLRMDEVVEHWARRHPTLDLEGSAEAVVSRLIELVEAEGELLPGVREAMAAVRDRDLRLGLASSSCKRIIDAVVGRFELDFEVLRSAEVERYGKPHPAVYINTAAALGVAPTECLALEDSVNGVLSACAARMTCYAVPGPQQIGDPRYAIADAVLDSLHDFEAAAL